MSLTDIIDKMFYEMHRLPATVFHKVCNWTKYTTSRIETGFGYLTLATYLGSAATITYIGTAKSTDMIDRSTTIGGALLLGIIYGRQLAKNFREANLAQKREEALEHQLLGSVVRYEEKLQRYRMRRQVPWYAASLPLWVGFMALFSILGGMDITNPVVLTMGGSAIVSTSCLYGARYVLTTDYNFKKQKK